MNIKKLKKGMEIKNYKELCSLLGESVKTGGAKNKQMKEFKKYFEFKKDGHSFVITKIYNKPRDGSNGVSKEQYAIDQKEFSKLYPKLKIDNRLKNRAGVYIIRKGREVYIGSTINFLNRFRQHNSPNNRNPSGKLMQNGGCMKILWLYEGDEISKKKLQKIIHTEEIKLIKKYILKDEFIVMNIDFNKNIKYKVKPKKFKPIYIKNEDIVKAMDILNNNDIEFRLNKKGDG